MMKIKSLGNGRYHIDVHVYPKYRIYRTYPLKGNKATFQEAKEQAQKWEKELLLKRDKEYTPKSLNFTRFNQVLLHWRNTPDKMGTNGKLSNTYMKD